MGRLRHLFGLALAVLLLGASAAAQNHAKATLYTRASGDDVFAAVVIRVDPDWYLYHTDLGHPDAIGVPTSFAFAGADVTWGEVRMKEPKVGSVDGQYLGKYTYNYHVGRTVGFAMGTRTDGASIEGLEVALVGQTCSHTVGTCVPYKETVATGGEGSDRYWNDWPEALGASPLAAAEDAPPVVEPPVQVQAEGSGGEVVEGEVTEGAPGDGEPEPEIDVFPVPLGPPVEVQPTEGGGGAQTNPFQAAKDDFAVGGPAKLSKVTGEVFVRVDEEDGLAQAAIVLVVAEGYHIYHGPTQADLGHEEAVAQPTTITIVGGDVEWGAPTYPPAERHDDGLTASDGSEIWSWVHEGRVRFLVTGVVIDEFDAEDLSVLVEGQICDASGCDTFELALEHAGEGADADFVALAPHGDSDGGGAAGSGILAGAVAVDAPLWKFLLEAVFWGIITLLMPCTYPMIPITISFFTKQAMSRNGSVLPLSMVYGAGIVGIFILIGLVAAPVIIPFATHPITNIVIGALFLFFAFVLFGVVTLQPPRAMMQLAGKASMKGGYGGVFLMGATLVVTSFTCTAPFVGTLLGSAAVSGASSGGGVLRIVLGMGVFGLTMATPFVLLSLLPGKLQQMPKAGEWMNTLKVFLGFVELAASFKFISNADIVWGWGLLSREVFLILWAVIFAAAGIFLIRKSFPKGQSVQKTPLVGGLLTLAFAAYCGWGAPGRQMDDVMTAVVPNYSNERLLTALGGEVFVDKHVVIKDDFEAAKARAIEEDKLLLVNFTGFT